jgi:hypothetical protein
MNHRSAAGPPAIEQGGYALLRFRIVSYAPRRMIDCFLKIDEEQGSIGRERQHVDGGKVIAPG